MRSRESLAFVLRRSGARWVLGLAIVVVLAGHALSRVDMRFVDTLDAMIYDAKVRLFMPRTTDSRIAILDIDEKSLAELGRWPWDRARMAMLVDTLFSREHIAVLGFDMVFAEPDASSGLAVLDELARGTLEGDTAYRRALDALAPRLDYDRRFADALAGHPVVLGFYFSNRDTSSGAIPSPSMSARAFGAHPFMLFDWTSYGGNLGALQDAAKRAGYFNPVIDFDGAVRRVPLIAAFRSGVYGALSLEVIRALFGDAALAPVFDDPADPAAPLAGLALTTPRGTRIIPVDANGAALVPYRGGTGSFPYYSIADVLAQRVPAGALAGKIALVGTTAPGLMDQRTTPVGEVYPGVEVNANLIGGMLDGTIRFEPPFARALQASMLAILGLAMIFLWPWRMPARATLLTVALAALVVAADLAAFARRGWSIPIASLLLAVLALYVLNMSYGYFVEARAKRHFAALFGQYVPPELVEEMSRHPEDYSMAGRRAELTVLFCDVLGFTAIAETLEPEALARLMNEYLGTMTEVIRAHRGTLDKYIGDAIMGFWGAPVDDPEHARHAVAAALGMRAALVELNRTLTARGWPTLWIGIGINTGPMTVGDMGSHVRRAYTVMGDAVNVAARLEGLTRRFDIDIIVGEATREQVPDIVFREIDRVRVKGRVAPIAVYEPQPAHEHGDALARWHAALAHYRAREWDEAQSLLATLAAQYPERQVYGLYRKRIEALRGVALPEDWDCVSEFDTK
ncbi:periplasmic sensor signal transduction histidine kinase [Caballeronia fortuita]|uniref:Periplasmic sensor signal transduction histidine kinase n=1 Tax=Caballeronia fortuita TaxID=1777138 RepID=A0A158E7T8_9BURK|nr:adenylate/guanylate cyclase domain-containing protein [Caballeronia fortuita]SAL02961.1 periplasmic sensor signal transduction histidine kinase [Caballeronia fortuita]